MTALRKEVCLLQTKTLYALEVAELLYRSQCTFVCLFSSCKHFHFLFISCQRASLLWCLPAKKDIRERLCCREEREYDPVHHPLDLVNKNSLKLSLTGTSAQNNSHRKRNSYPLTLPTVYLAITVDLKVPVCPTSAHNTCQIYTALGKVTVAFRTGLRKKRAA